MSTVITFLLMIIPFCLPAAFAENDPVKMLMSDDSDTRKKGAKIIDESKDKTYISSVAEVAFYFTLKRDRAAVDEISKILQKLTGYQEGEKYFDWMKWIGKHPEIPGRRGYIELKQQVLSIIDPNLAAFLNEPSTLRIRAEEIVWGGVRKDGIPALINSPVIPEKEATYLKDNDPVFGIFVHGVARAYPLKIMDWHEMANDKIGDTSVAIPYCTLCGSAIAYKPVHEGITYTFGSSGLLYRSNKLMYDHQTNSLWSALSGEPVAGKLAGRGIQLELLPIVRSTWGEWKRLHPETTVLSLNTGHARDYTKEPYKEYFESDKTMFPVPQEDAKVAAKEVVFAIRMGKTKKAYPLSILKQRKFLTDNVEERLIALITDPEAKSVRAYRCDNANPQESWKADEESLTSPDSSQKCTRLPGHLAYWFGWYAQFPDTELFGD